MDYGYSNVPANEEASQAESGSAKANKLRYPKAAAGLRWTMPRSPCVIAVAAATLTIVALAGFVLGSTATRMAMPTAVSTVDEIGGQIDDCGETPAQARANGCRYDPMIQQWVPTACYDEEHSEMYLSTYKWKWYYDLDAKHEMPDEVMRRGEHNVAFMVDDYHRRHCAYVWEVSARALQQQKPMLDEWLSYKHVHHCNRLLLSPPWNSTKHPTAVETHSGFGRCAPYRLWARDMPE
ncbi:hypothetical protein GCG54_00002924 [Colletotrichum gloeosporioides]|uniref:Uncharacterized protein n=1 Tax=Colletotrichum gloeosporioides TaxID=474922 RepID=A0A8H4CXU3_COLGL|nr:uncharacterized protein GCG54_00002924 [Colletotrichum gloeosporioides]KAF3811972.1 hypothetical protein GCG54_00002924 [Colletotrichum gloeosporioides]